MNILVTGATGYIGGRLIPLLLEMGHSVKILVRDDSRIKGREWAGQVEIITGDLTDAGSLKDIFRDVDASYYLVHSMYGGSDFQERDKIAAKNFAAAASGVKHTIYLGGHMPAPHLRPSRHLASRSEVGKILGERLPITEFRAGVIIGSGSASFEIVRYLTERLPVMVTPRWVQNECQPIGIRDILQYLVSALDTGPLGIVEVGSERITFREMMSVYAEVRGLKRLIFPTPVLTPKLAALWIGLVTPIPNTLAIPVVEGLIHSVTADTSAAEKHFPSIQPMPYREAVQLALRRVEDNQVATRWTGSMGGEEALKLKSEEGLIHEIRTIHVNATPEAVFKSFTSLGGDRGWPAMDWAWRLRGEIDRLSGGPGLRRGRRDPVKLLPGEALDFWRVEDVIEPRLLRLRAEMKVPGRAWLQFEAIPENGGARLVQTALFEPRGLAGILYWYSLYPAHKIIFGKMVRVIAEDAMKNG